MYTICVDIDNVLNNLTERVLDVYNSTGGKNIHLDNITAYNFYDCLSKQDADGIIDLFEKSDVWHSLTPIEDSQWAIDTLIKTGHRVIFATATAPCNFSWKIEWMKKHFPFVDSNDVIRIIDKSLIKCDILIDDCLDQLTKSACERICFNYPWNQSETKDYVYDIKRADGWRDIIKLINDIERGEN